MKLSSFVLFILALAFASQHQIHAAPRAPNIIFILVDDMGYYDLSCYGATEVHTRRIDQLASEGLRFTDFYAAAPICSPSRAGLLTGCYPRRVGNHIWVHRPDSDYGLHPEELTLAELLKQKGYQTACIGKWHLGFDEPLLPRNQGFDHYFGLLHNLDAFETRHYDAEGGVPLIRNGKVIERPADPATLTRLYTHEAMDWISSCVKEQQSLKAPFFLYLPHTMLHHPIGVSEEFRGTSDWGEYGDAILELDHHVGRLMDKLEELDIADNTLVVYMSDNGRGPGRTADQPLRGSKLTTWEGGLKVPCMVWGPGVGIPSGSTIANLSHAMDWYPTLASMAGIRIPEGRVIDGRDLSSLILGKAKEIGYQQDEIAINAEVVLRRPWDPDLEWSELISREEYLNAFFYHGSHGALGAVRSGKWKLHLHPDLTLYNLEEDPGESTPVNDPALTWRLRGLVVLFQEEMRLHHRPAGQAEKSQNETHEL